MFKRKHTPPPPPPTLVAYRASCAFGPGLAATATIRWSDGIITPVCANHLALIKQMSNELATILTTTGAE